MHQLSIWFKVAAANQVLLEYGSQSGARLFFW